MSLVRWSNSNIFRIPIMVWMIAVLLSVLLHFFLKFIILRLFGSESPDIETYLCCTTAFTMTRTTGVGLVLTTLMNLFFSFLMDRKILMSRLTYRFKISPLLVITIALRILVSVWLYTYWKEFVGDMAARQILASGHTTVPYSFLLVLSVNAILAGYIIIIEPLQDLGARWSQSRYQRLEKSFPSSLSQISLYIPSMIRSGIYMFIFLLFAWSVKSVLSTLIVGYILMATLFVVILLTPFLGQKYQT